MHSPYDSGDDWDDNYYEHFVKFVGQATSGRFLVIATIEYLLPFNESALDVLTVRSPPQNVTLPLEECYQQCVQTFVENSLRRVQEGTLEGLSFKWDHVDGVHGGDVAQGSRHSDSR